MKAIASPAAESTQPVLSAVATTTVPAATDAPATPRPTSVTLACAPSDARSRTQTAPVLVASTATTLSAAPVDRIATGAAIEIAIGSADSALASETVDCAAALAPSSAAAV